MSVTSNAQHGTDKEGWLYRKSKYGRFNRRFMQLTDTKIFCYKSIQFNKAKQSPSQTFDLALHFYRVSAHETASQLFTLINDSLCTSHSFKALTVFDQQSWVYSITAAIKSVASNNTKTTPLVSFNTEVIYYKNADQMNDSDSDQNIQELTNDKTKMKRKLSKRKHEKDIGPSSFNNFRIRSLTVDPLMLPDFDDDDDDDFKSYKNSIMLAPTQTRFASMFSNDGDKLYDIMDDNKANHEDNEIVDYFIELGYKENDIESVLKNMDHAANIDQIRDKLEEEHKCELVKARRSAIFEHDAVFHERLKKKKLIEKELVLSEKIYCQAIDVLLNEFLQAIFDNNYVDDKYYNEIRSSLPKIYAFHQDLVCQFEYFAEDKTEDKSIINVFKEYFMKHREVFIDIHSAYITDYQSICALFGITFHGNTKLDNFLKAKRKTMQPLSTFLMIPVQRVPAYIHLLTQLQLNTDESNADYNDIHAAVQLMEGITKTISEKKEHIENYTQCLQIQEALNGLKQSIVSAHRKYIGQFIFVKKEIKHQRLFFLFSDIVIVANEKWKVKLILDIRTLDVKLEKSHTKKRNLQLRKKRHSKQILPEFILISSVAGRAIYVAQDAETIARFEQLVGKCRVEMMSVDVRARFNTLGDLRHELNRQAQMYGKVTLDLK